MNSQRDNIRAHFKRGLSLTPMEALRLYGSFRLAAVVYHLKEFEHMNIKTEMVQDRHGKMYARYKLEQIIEID